MSAFVECRSCGGEGHHGLDEDGRFYSCYACGETGSMTVEAAAEWDEENAPFCGPLLPVYRGEFGDYWDDEEPRPLDARAAAAAAAAVAAFWASASAFALDDLMNDDIPF